MQLEGIVGAPYSHPRVQKKMPAPYQRPSISVGEPEVKRVWQQRPISEVVVGDVVANFGKVKFTQEHIQIPDSPATLDQNDTWVFTLTNVFGVTKDFPGHETVMVFASP